MRCTRGQAGVHKGYTGQSPAIKTIHWEWRFPIQGDTLDRSRVEFYDTPRDPSELNNLAGRQPQIVVRLAEKALAWQKTLPAGPVEPSAGKNDYPWPGR